MFAGEEGKGACRREEDGWNKGGGGREERRGEGRLADGEEGETRKRSEGRRERRLKGGERMVKEGN